MVKKTKTLDQLREEAVAEVAAALAKPLSVGGDDGYERGYQQAMQEMQAKLKVLTTAVASGCGRAVTSSVSDYMQSMVRDYRQTIYNDMPLLLPQGTRFLTTTSHDGGLRGLLVVEEQPQIRTILVMNDADEDVTIPYHLSMPYVVFVITFSQTSRSIVRMESLDIAFRKEPLRTVDDGEWYHPALPNFSQYRVCMSTQSTRWDSISDMASEVISTFWGSLFEPYFEGFGMGDLHSIRSFRDWQNLSDPLSILKAEFDEGNFNLRTVVKRFANSDANVIASRAWVNLQPLTEPTVVEALVRRATEEAVSKFTNSKS